MDREVTDLVLTKLVELTQLGLTGYAVKRGFDWLTAWLGSPRRGTVFVRQDEERE